MSPEGEHLEFAIKSAFITTNNEAEYEAIIPGMELAREMGVMILERRSDSQVVTGHIRREYEARGEKMKEYLSKVQELERAFERLLVTRVPREDNSRTDSLYKLGSATNEDTEASKLQVQTLHQPSIVQPVNVMSVKVIESLEYPEWDDEVIQYLKEG